MNPIHIESETNIKLKIKPDWKSKEFTGDFGEVFPENHQFTNGFLISKNDEMDLKMTIRSVDNQYRFVSEIQC